MEPLFCSANTFILSQRLKVALSCGCGEGFCYDPSARCYALMGESDRKETTEAVKYEEILEELKCLC